MNTKNTLKVKLSLFFAVAFSLLILFLSLINQSKLEVINLKINDKIYHTLSYLLMIFLWFKYKNKSIQNKLKFLIASLILTFGIIIEVMQLVLTNYRSFDLLDILANALGIMCGLILFLPIEKYFINKNI
jgi:hypothetical protein